MKKPFNLQSWLKDKSQKVVNSEGKEVRIICWDRKGRFPVIGLIENLTIQQYNEEGEKIYFGEMHWGPDLFLVTEDEPELSEFEEAVYGLLEEVRSFDEPFTCDELVDYAKKEASDLLFVACKQLKAEGWEISNYDDEDKPHHLNPPVSKWIDFPSEKQKEQKPSAPNKYDEKMRKKIIDHLESIKMGCVICTIDTSEEIAWLEKQKEQNLIMANSPQLKEQKPAEEDEDTDFELRLMDCMSAAQQYSHEIEWDVVKSWAKELSELCPHPRPEWSEEDEKMLGLICANLSDATRHSIRLTMDSVNEMCDWLRTLQCRPLVSTDWNDEDQTLLSDALGCVTMVQELKKRGELKDFHISCTGEELRSWIRSLKSRPRKCSWKPSEEQMEALKALNLDGAISYVGQQNLLISLYNDLKKLM